jgi:hypothetical protein
VLHHNPYKKATLNHFEAFNLLFAYLFLMVLQIFSQKHWEDFSEEDVQKIEVEGEIVLSELFVTPHTKQGFGWVTVYILAFYIVVHMTFFVKALV